MYRTFVTSLIVALVLILNFGGAASIAADNSSNPAMKARVEAAHQAYERMLDGNMLASDKALIEEFYPVRQAAPVRDPNGSLDDNGGVWFNWTGTLAIPDAACPTLVTAPITVSGLGASLLDVEVKIVNLTHTYDGDLNIYLLGPNGVQIELSTANGTSGDNFVNTVFDDEATTLISAGVAPFTGNFRPDGLLEHV